MDHNITTLELLVIIEAYSTKTKSIDFAINQSENSKLLLNYLCSGYYYSNKKKVPSGIQKWASGQPDYLFVQGPQSSVCITGDLKWDNCFSDGDYRKFLCQRSI